MGDYAAQMAGGEVREALEDLIYCGLAYQEAHERLQEAQERLQEAQERLRRLLASRLPGPAQ